MELLKASLPIDGEIITCEYVLKEENAVILHGAGQANRQRYYSMATRFLDRGIGVVLFDFSGHGDSSGSLQDLSLERRVLQASGVIDTVLPQKSVFYLVGFSMSGQTVCELVMKPFAPRQSIECHGLTRIIDQNTHELAIENFRRSE
jgi:pimeloyl-ACP methyl ester carboxylesterase